MFSGLRNFTRRGLFRQGGLLAAAAQIIGTRTQTASAAGLDIGPESLPLHRRSTDHQRPRHLHHHHRVPDASRSEARHG